jgi:hypothetical protein
MSRLNSGVPIYALTPEVAHAATSCRCIAACTPVLMSQARSEALLPTATAAGATPKTESDRRDRRWHQHVKIVGDLIVLSFGEPIGRSQPGGTNTLKIVKVGEYRQPPRRQSGPSFTSRRIPCLSSPCASCSTTPPKTATDARVQRQQPRTGAGHHEAAAELDAPVIMQASAGARKYAGEPSSST